MKKLETPKCFICGKRVKSVQNGKCFHCRLVWANQINYKNRHKKKT